MEKKIEVRRLGAGGDWDCDVCGGEPWNHYAIIINGKIHYICKTCIEKAPFTDEIKEIEKVAKRQLKTTKNGKLQRLYV